MGPSIGWAIINGVQILVANVIGLLTGEWKGASKKSANWIVAGIIVLMLGVSVLARGNYMHGEYEKELKKAAEASQTQQE